MVEMFVDFGVLVCSVFICKQWISSDYSFFYILNFGLLVSERIG